MTDSENSMIDRRFVVSSVAAYVQFGVKPRPASPETIRIIMKDGVIYKNSL